jgi:hypothetical protein
MQALERSNTLLVHSLKAQELSLPELETRHILQ